MRYNTIQLDAMRYKTRKYIIIDEIEYSTIVEIKIQHDTIQNNAIP